MIALWKKELILNRLKEENNGNLDYLTIDDVTIEPFGAKNQLRTLKYRIVDEEIGWDKENTIRATTLIDLSTYGGKYNYDASSYTHGGFQKYVITGKPERFVIGKFIIAARLPDPDAILYRPSTTWMSCTKPTGTNVNYDKIFSSNLIMDTTLLKGRNIDKLTKEELVELLPGNFALGPEDFSDITITHVNIPENKTWDREHEHYIIDSYGFNYIQVVYSLQMNEAEASLDYSHVYNLDDGMLKPNGAWFTIFIINKDIYADATKLFYGGNTDNLKVSYEDGDVTLTGVNPNRENLPMATVGLSLLHEDCPEFADMQYNYFFEFYYRDRYAGDLYIHKLSNEVQKIIIDTMARFHHWKWGIQNQPGVYSEIPSSHNLKNAKVFIKDKQAYKYRDISPGIGNGIVHKLYPSKKPTIPFNKESVYDRRDPNENVEQLVSIGIAIDEEYNTGYEGDMYLQIYAKTKFFDAGDQRGSN